MNTLSLLRKTKINKPLAFGVLALVTICSDTNAGSEGPVAYQQTVPTLSPVYWGAFGGGGTSRDRSFTQRGVALYEYEGSYAGPAPGGPVYVNAQSIADVDSVGMVGMHVGYTARERSLGHEWGLVPAIELESYYLRATETGSLSNPIPRLTEHLFIDSFPMNTGVFLTNEVFTLNSLRMSKVHPYIGGGIGTAILSISGANSVQVSPAEPGINHFNTNQNASNWTFAAQGKTGLLFDVAEHWRIFAEYRYLYLSPTFYTFGSTSYATHIPTTSWSVAFAGMNVNMGSAGIQYSF
jgi:hypothetical protein